ncbi:amidase [Candidatus Bathyarchaeota archaeon]|nr:amidase [Candidatus Bathyarchaeota archaeon]
MGRAVQRLQTLQEGGTVNPVFTPVRELSDKIRRGEASPVELAETFLGRLEKYGPVLNSVVTLTRERALKQARKAEDEIKKGKHRGALHGVPYGGKDLLATGGGIPTTWGAAPFKGRVLGYDAAVVEKLEAAGSVLLAKLAMIELAGGMGYKQPNASFTGPCATPWSPRHWSGGSSSGSGASVAAGLVPYAIGSETWGSILSPANNCGVAGLRPTYGRVSRHGAMALSWTLDKLGPLCQTADDCGLVLEAIAGRDPRDPSTTEKPYRYELKDGGLRIAVPRDALEGVEEPVARNFKESIRVVEKFAEVEEITFPEFPYEAVTRTILNAEAASAFDEFTEKGLARGLTAPECRYGSYARTAVLASDYLKALRLRQRMAVIAEDVMAPYDAVAAPSKRTTVPVIDEEFRKTTPGTARDVMGALGNGAGLPAISVPSGFDDGGLPTGIHFMGRAYGENSVLSVAVEYQIRTKWHTMHPDRFTP